MVPANPGSPGKMAIKMERKTDREMNKHTSITQTDGQLKTQTRCVLVAMMRRRRRFAEEDLSQSPSSSLSASAVLLVLRNECAAAGPPCQSHVIMYCHVYKHTTTHHFTSASVTLSASASMPRIINSVRHLLFGFCLTGLYFQRLLHVRLDPQRSPEVKPGARYFTCQLPFQSPI